MAKVFKKQPLLPSLLDRLTDDSYTSRNIEACKQRITALEKELLSFTDTGTNKQVEQEQNKAQENDLRSELEKQRKRITFLYGSTASLDKIKDCVKRDLTWLLNTQNLSMDTYLEEYYPNVASSVINFGMPDMTGRTVSSLNSGELERYIKKAILSFEPRLIRHTVKVNLFTEESKMDNNAIIFKIEADLWMDPEPLHLQLKTQIDLENGYVDVKEN